MRRKNKRIENVKISGIADKGKAVGRDEQNIVYFIDGPVPGDVVNIIRTKKRKGVYQGIVSDYISKSPNRVTPQCDHFGTCGGCKWQHFDYSEQLLHKEQRVQDMMRRIGHFEDYEILPIKGADKRYAYRNKIEYSFSNKRWLTDEEINSTETIQQSPAAGFHRAGAFDKVLNINTCHLQEDTGNQIRDFVKSFAISQSWPFYDARNKEGFIRSLFLRNNEKGEWMINAVFAYRDMPEINAMLDALQTKFPQIKSGHFMINTKPNDSVWDLEAEHAFGEAYLDMPLGHLQFKIGPKSFFQTNTSQAKILFDIVLSLAELTGEETVYDLYSGIGTIGFYLANKASKIVGIEEVKEATEDAKVNATLNNIDNASFYCGDVKEILTTDFENKHGKADLIITDPPRAGMHKDIIAMLLQLNAPKIIYISCNPATQARDLSLLEEGYTLIKTQAVDMFPHTHHIENVALLVAKSS